MKLRTLYSNEIKEQKAGSLIDPRVLGALVIVFIISDFFSLFGVVDAIFYQYWYLSWMVTGITAIILEVFPLLGARFLMKPDRTTKDNYILGALGAGFAILVIAIIYLRYNTQEIMFSSTDAQLNITGISGIDNSYTASRAEQAMTLLMACLPILTSIAAFILTLMSPPSEKLKNLRKRNKILLKDELIALNAYESELRNELEINLVEHDDALYENMLQEINHYGELMRRRVRELSAEFIGNPQGVSDLLESTDNYEPIKQDDDKETKFITSENEKYNVAA